MKLLKKLTPMLVAFALVMVCLLVFSTEASAVESGTCGDNLTWVLDDTGTLTISGTGPMYDYYYDKKPWDSGYEAVKNVVIEEGVTTVGCGAFADYLNLQTVQLPSSITEIGEMAFFYCDRLHTINLPQNITAIGAEAFSSCESLRSITIPAKVTTLWDLTFSYCTGLRIIALPAGLTRIDDQVFMGSSNLVVVHYNGTKDQKAKMEIGFSNEELESAIWHYPDSLSVKEGNGYAEYTCKLCTYSYQEPYRFPDVKPSAWYNRAVNFAVDKGYFTGHGNGNFAPSDGITRQDFVVVLARIAGADLSKYSGQTSFTDVSPKAYYAKAIHWASSNGVVMGYDATRFGVGDKITREQLVTILYRYAMKQGYDIKVSANAMPKLDAFADSKSVGKALRPACAWALEKGVLSGKNETTFDPQGAATRAQVATMLMNISLKNIMPI